MLEIDGAYKSAGGQILRTALALSSLTKQPFTIQNIRKGREEPGLKEQHLQTVRAATKLCNARIQGDKLYSTELSFTPNKITNTDLEIDIATAGSTALVLQSLLIPGIKHNLNIHITGGGTFNLHAPSLIYIQKILIHLLQKMDYKVFIEVKRHGFYPKGGAEIIIKTRKKKKGGKKKKIFFFFSSASDSLKNRNVAERQSSTAQKILNNNIGVSNKYVQTICPGSGILLAAEFENTFLGYDAVGERNKTAEMVGEEAALGLQKQINSKAVVDGFMSDQILPYLALAKGKSIIKIPELTQHAETNIWLIKQFLNVDFRIKDNVIYVSPG